MAIDLTKADMNAIKTNDHQYLNSKGAKYYTDEDYEKAVEYYRIAAAMGNVQAISNLGYCYLYGRSIEANTSEAIAMFTIAADRMCLDAMYKLGDIYSSKKWDNQDTEMSLYYYNKAASLLLSEDWDYGDGVIWAHELHAYPSLCFALGRELAPGGNMNTNIAASYQMLKHAEIGYKREVENGANFYKTAYDNVLTMLEDPIYDEYKVKYAHVYDGFDDDDDDEECDDPRKYIL